MSGLRRNHAFTLIELLVVVAIIALLVSILLPSLSQAREQGKKAVCLSNLKAIAQASHTYAAEDLREQIIPLSAIHIRQPLTAGFHGEWGWRTGLPYSFGGRTPQKAMIVDGSPIKLMLAKTDGGNGWWEAHRRPLNRYVYGDIDQADATKMKLFHCPSDRGYPNNPRWVQDCPPSSFEIPLYDMVGNGYRINTCGALYAGETVSASFQSSAEGHTASSIVAPSRVVMYSEPLFYNMSRQSGAYGDPTVSRLRGWHGGVMSDNVAYCDGSAATTRVDKIAEFDLDTLLKMNYTANFPFGEAPSYFLRRGKTWQTDAYPTPGALIRRYNFAGGTLPNGFENMRGWPFDGHQSNGPPN